MLFRDGVYNRVNREYSDIRQDFALVDVPSLGFVKNSKHSGVMVVTSKLFEDVITDL